MKEKTTAIVNANVFDGINAIGKKTVVVKGEKIVQVGGEIPADAEIIDATGCTLLPGLIDVHTHPNMEALRLNLAFGVTTTFQMQGYFSEQQVKEIAERHDIADCLKSFMAIGAPGGHPSELLPPKIKAKQREMVAKSGIKLNKTATTADEAEQRVASRLSPAWQECLKNQINTYPEGNTGDVLKSVKALHEAGVTLLAGSDASQPGVGGMVHGASLHHELCLLVEAGLTPAEALQTATFNAARCFGLTDRGQIAEGKRADLLLVDDDPTKDITDTLSIVSIWRQGTRFVEE